MTAKSESPLQFARRVGIDVKGGEFLLWTSLVQPAFEAYWRKRVEDSAAVRRGEAPPAGEVAA
ncbi:MAG TPA: hypothetical protein VNT51_06640 [Miltoncostaeaceae bacterium]|nr:hypothetical protein [Miltoncostaeaceae bacterium]